VFNELIDDLHLLISFIILVKDDNCKIKASVICYYYHIHHFYFYVGIINTIVSIIIR